MNAKQLAEKIHAAISPKPNTPDTDLGEIESIDRDVGDDGSFTLSYCVDRPNPTYTGRGPSSHLPVGHFEFKVTVTRTWVPFEEGTPEPE